MLLNRCRNNLERANAVNLYDAFSFRPPKVGHLLRHQGVVPNTKFPQCAAIELVTHTEETRALNHYDVFVFWMPMRRHYGVGIALNPNNKRSTRFIWISGNLPVLLSC